VENNQFPNPNIQIMTEYPIPNVLNKKAGDQRTEKGGVRPVIGGLVLGAYLELGIWLLVIDPH
jgi:hypothetical protein